MLEILVWIVFLNDHFSNLSSLLIVQYNTHTQWVKSKISKDKSLYFGKISIQDLWGKSANVNNYSSLFASHFFHKLYTIYALSDAPTKAPAIKRTYTFCSIFLINLYSSISEHNLAIIRLWTIHLRCRHFLAVWSDFLFFSPPEDFTRSVNPISTREGTLYQPHYYLPL